MLVPTIKVILIMALGLGTTLTFLSSHWFMAWIGLEINMYAILPLMMHHHHPRSSEAALKYLLIQATASGLLLFATATNALFGKGEWLITHLEHPATISLAMFALATKLGAAPFHFWFPEVMQGLDLKTGLILATWQKLAPFALLIQISRDLSPYALITIGLISAIVGAWAGLNQTQIRKILAYSSISNLGWMFVIVHFAPDVSLYALIIYIMMVLATFLSLMETSTTKISSLTMAWSKSSITMVVLALILLSLAGLPPLTGFSPKLFMLQELSKQEMALPTTLLLMSALISLYFYIRLFYFSSITLFPGSTNSKISWRRNNRQDKVTLAVTATLTMVTLPLTPFIMMLIHFSMYF